MHNMKQLADIDLPDELRIDSLVRNVDGDTNDVFFCKGDFDGRASRAYIKVSKHPQSSLANEQAVLTELKKTGVPVPEVIWYGREKSEVLIVEAIVGDMIWDYIDPRRGSYDRDKALLYLHAYGECLAQVHSLDIAWPAQKRPRLYGLIGEERVEDERFRRLVSWVQANNATGPGQVFVHGDFNTASVLFHDDSISGVIDWEFAGRGWREYDLAWTLRARSRFLNTEAERKAILDGYAQCSSHDEEALRWCEVLNYLHFAYWTRECEPAYTSFALDRAMDVAELT